MTNKAISKKPNISNITKVTSYLPNAIDAGCGSFNQLIGQYLDYKTTVEREQTKRQAISGWRDIQLKKLEDQRQNVEKYIVLIFGERANNISQLFERMDKAIDDNNLEVFNMCLGGIVDIAKTSPLSGINQLIAQYNDPSVEEIVL